MTEQRSRGDRVEEYTDRVVSRLQAAYRRDDRHAVAALARLRRQVGRSPGTDLQAFADVFGADRDAAADTDAAPVIALHESQRLPDGPTREEAAVFSAVTLFALHQQSRRDASVHRRGYSFGRSARLLSRRSSPDAVRRRFVAVGTATTLDELVTHARGLIQQFRQYELPLDYARFARDLFILGGPSGADSVRTVWGRDYFRAHHADDDDDESAESGSADPDTASAD